MARTFSDLVKGVEAKEKAQAEAARVAQPAAPAEYAVAPAPVAATPTTPAKPKKESAAPSAPKVTAPKGQVKVKPEDQLAAAPAQATIVVPDEVKREIDYRAFYDASRDPTVTMAVRTAAANMGMTPADFRKAAQAQGVSLESIHAARMKGRTYEQVAQANRERGVLGFMPVPEREATFKSTVERAEAAARGEAPTSIKLKESGADKGLLGGYVAAGTREVLPEVTRPGEYGYLTSQLLVDALKKDPEASRIYDLYGRKLGVGNTQKAIETRVKQLSQRAGISAADPESDTKMRALRKRAINEIIAWKTVGQWTPAITMQDVQATEGEEAPGVFAALGPNVEIIGFNNDGQAITRQESPLSVLFRAIDLPQEMTVGALEKGGTAAQGVQTNANFLEFALDHTEDSTPLVRYPALAAGLAASIVFPDALLAAGAVGKVGKAAKQIYNVRKIAPEATALLETIAKARSTRNFDKAKEAEIALRAKFPAVADEFDRYDASAAQFINMKRPESASFDEDLSALIASRVPAASEEVAAGRVHLHPSVRKDVLGVKTPTKDTPLASYFELFNTPALKDRVARAKAAFLAAAPSTREAYLADFARGTVRDALAAPLAAGKVTAAQVDEIADLVAARAPLMLTDEDTWRTAVRDALKVHPEFGKPEFSNVRKSVYVPGRNSVRTRLARKATEIAGMDIADLTAADVALFDRAMQAIDDNNEARGLAASLLRDRVAADARIKVTPLNLFDDVAPTLPGGEPIRLSPGGLLLLKQVRKAMPDADLKELYASVSVIDRMIVGAARKREVDPFTLYGETFPSIRRATAEDVARLGGRAGGAPPTTPPAAPAPTAAPTAAPAAAAPAPAPVTTAPRAVAPTPAAPAAPVVAPTPTPAPAVISAAPEVTEATVPRIAAATEEVTESTVPRIAAPAAEVTEATVPRVAPEVTEVTAPRVAAEAAAAPEVTGSIPSRIYSRTGMAPTPDDLAEIARDSRVTSFADAERYYPSVVIDDTVPGLVNAAKAERRRVWNEITELRKTLEEAPAAATAAKRIILPADATWLAYFRKVLPAQKPGDALRAAVKRVEALYEDEDFARSLATRQATNRILGVDPEAVLAAPEAERNAMLQALDVDGGVSESDLLDYTPIHQMLDLTPAKALEMGKFPAGTKAAQITPEILENLAERIVEIAGETGDFAEVTGAMRAMGGAAEESLADVRYAAQELQSRIVPMDKEAAFAFVRKHHSKLPTPRPSGLLAAVGLAGAGETRVVGLLNHPSGPFAKDKVFGVVELSRVASDGTLKGGASAITLWSMENLQRFNRSGEPLKARFVTTALLSEPGEVYKALDGVVVPTGISAKDIERAAETGNIFVLVKTPEQAAQLRRMPESSGDVYKALEGVTVPSKATAKEIAEAVAKNQIVAETDTLHPTSMVTPSKPSGSRAGAVGTARKDEWKINWEFGPAAAPAQPHLYDLPPVFRDVVTNKEKLSIKRLNSLVRRPGVDTVQAYKDAARVLGVSSDEPAMKASRLASRANEAGRQKIADDLRYMLLERFNSKQVADMDVKEQSALRAAAAPTTAAPAMPAKTPTRTAAAVVEAAPDVEALRVEGRKILAELPEFTDDPMPPAMRAASQKSDAAHAQSWLYGREMQPITLGNRLADTTDTVPALVEQIARRISSDVGYATWTAGKAAGVPTPGALQSAWGKRASAVFYKVRDMAPSVERRRYQTAAHLALAELAPKSDNYMAGVAERIASALEADPKVVEVRRQLAAARAAVNPAEFATAAKKPSAEMAKFREVEAAAAKEINRVALPAAAAEFKRLGLTENKVADEIARSAAQVGQTEAKRIAKETFAAPTTPSGITAVAEAPVVTQKVVPTAPTFASAKDAVAAAAKSRAVTTTPEFKAWFGASKVTDTNGQPLLMFHGTSGAGFSEFITRGEHGLMGQGAYFTDNPSIAASYVEAGRGAGDAPGIYPVYLSIRNPLDMDAPADIAVWKRDLVAPVNPELEAQRAKFPQLVDYDADAIAIAKENFRPGMTNEQVYKTLVAAYNEVGVGLDDAADSITEAIQRMGYDGVTHIGGGRFKRGSEAHRVYIAFEPTQIKSATANVGAFSSTEPSILRQVSPTGATKGAVDMLADGRQVIILFEGADVSTVLHEAAHIIRRNILSSEDMNAITAWVTSRGVRVGHEFGEFTGDAAEIEKAEELFAQAFERYVMEGRAPTASLTNVFEVLKQALLDIYRGVRDPVLGVDLKPEVRAVFDGLLADVPEQASPTLKQVLRREMLGTDEEEVTGPLGILAREATRKGMPRTSEEDLIRQFESAQSRGVPQDQVYVSFPAPVMGKRDWTFDELAELQATREESRRVARARERGIRLDLTGRGYGEAAQITEDSAVETLRGALSAVEGETGAKAVVRGALRTVAATFFGGDVVKEKGMRLLPPELRRALDTSERVVEQGIGDTVSLLNDALRTKKDQALFRYLGGGAQVRRVDGRPILSAGYDYMGAVKNMFVRSIGTLDTDEVDALRQLADAVNSPDPGKALATLGFNGDGTTFAVADAARQKTQALAVKAINKILYLQGKAAESDFGSALASALRGAVEASPVPRPTHEMRLVEVITYISGVTARDGKMFVGDSATMARTLAGDVRSIYNEESARRVLVLVGGFGSADKAKLQLVKLNLGVTEDTKRAFSNWLVGESWDPAESENIQRLVDRYGMNPEFVKDTVLDTTFYVPRLARERMAKALARATYRPDVAATGADTFNAVYRYMKTRMTRGSFFIRQRYYMMNTVDHFIQLGMTAGFGVAASSVTRVIAQDLMVLPGWQQVVELLRKLPGGQRIPEDALEIVRRGLQRGGDVVAQRIGQMFGAGKYRIEVNPILEGLDGGFRAGNKVYSYREIRNIAVEEGVFASFDTRELADAIQREGELAIRGRGALTGGSALSTSSGSGKINNFFADWQKTVSSTAEAWGERERLGAMVALMEAGHDPRTAARLTIDALYDYSQSMTKADRSLLVGVLFPFWAFQKNANAQVFNLMFSPWGAYRMMCIRRARERGAELLAEVLYNDVGNDYGVDVKRMPPELQDSFYSIVTAVENEYNGEIPEDVKRALRLLFTGRGRDIMDGRLVEASAEIQRLREVGAFAEMQKFAEYAALRPDISGRGSYNRDRIGIPVMFPRTAPVRQYYRMVGDQHSYIEAYLPESSIEAGFKHHTQFLAAYVLMGAAPYDFLTGNLTEQGYKEVTVKNVLAPVADPERSPILGPLLADVSPDLVPPTRLGDVYAVPAQTMAKVHPAIGKQMDDLFGTTFLRVGAINDPFVGGAREGDMKELSEESIREIKMLQEQYPDTAILRDQRYYLPGGVWSTLFQNSPLGEFNNLAIRYEENPEERPDIRGEMLRWARGVLGLDVAFVSPKKTVRREEPKKLKETKNP